MFWLTFKRFPVQINRSGAKELRFRQNKKWQAKFSQNTSKNIFLIACSIFAPENIHQIARFQLGKKKIQCFKGAHILWCEFLCFSSFLSELTGHSRNLVGGWGLVQLRFWSYISSMPVSLFVQVYSLKPGKLHVAQNRCKGGWAWSNV